MTYAIKLPSGDHLDLLPGTQLGFELQNSIFTGSDITVLPGSFSFPVELPASPMNRRLLNFPDLVTSVSLPQPIENVWIYAAGQPIFLGILTIRSASERRILVNIVANPMANTKNTPLNELNLGGDRSIGANDTARLAHFKATLETPENYDYIFCPIYNNFFFGEEKASPYVWQNRWDSAAQDLLLTGETIDPGGGNPTYTLPPPIMPMPKVSYIIQQIVETSADGWTLVNNFQSTSEMKRLVLLSIFSIWEAPNTAGNEPRLPDTINLQQHVSNTRANEFLKKLAITFQLGIFANPFKKEIEISPLEEVLSKPVKYDWTDYAIEGTLIEFDREEPPLYLCHQSTGDDLTAYNIDPEIELPHYQDQSEFAGAIAGLDDGLYYLETTEIVKEVFTVDGNKNARTLGRLRRCKKFDASPVFETPLEIPLTIEWVHPYDSQDVPMVNREGSSIDETDHSNHIWERNQAENFDCIYFYRGIQNNYTTGLGVDIPYTSVHRYNPESDYLSDAIAQITTSGVSEGDAQHSLLWGSDFYEITGLFDDYWKTFLEMRRNGKPVTVQLILPIAALTSFSFKDKIRILNMDYFVKSLRITKLYPDARFLIEAKLFSVI